MAHSQSIWLPRFATAWVSQDSRVLQGVIKGFPIALGYFPLGIPFGVLASQQGLSLLSTVAMSFAVIGSVQFVALSLLASGEPVVSVVASTFVINFRYLVMSSALVPYLSQWPALSRLAFSLGLTDDLFALHSCEFSRSEPDPRVAIAANITGQLGWTAAGAVGFLLGAVLQDVRPLGMDFTLPAMFIAFLVAQITDRRALILAVVSGLAALILTAIGGRLCGLFGATLVGALLGAVTESWKQK